MTIMNSWAPYFSSGCTKPHTTIKLMLLQMEKLTKGRWKVNQAHCGRFCRGTGPALLNSVGMLEYRFVFSLIFIL